MERIRLGVIGAGVMGERLLRAAAEHAPEVVALAGVWDPAAEAVGRVCAAVPGLAAAPDSAALIAASDCVYVASPPASHLAHADAALAAGKSVFCEKPLAVDLAEARRFAAAHADARFAVNFPFASSFAVAALRDWVANGAVDTPASFTIEVAFHAWPRPWQEAAAAWLDAPAEGGFTREVVSHFLFLSRRLLGPLALGHHEIEHGPRTERAVRATLTAGALPGRLDGGVGITEAADENRWTLTGASGAVRLRDWSIAERRGGDGQWVPDAQALPNERMRPLVLRRQLEGVAAMTRGEPHALATLAEALEVQEVVEALLAGDGHG